jgi:transcriptional regulator with XRE-family HTH domain
VAQCKEDFAARLRELRVQAGSPPFRHLAKIANYSSSTLADATLGRRLPTESVLTALVTACGADPAPWTEDLRRIAAAELSLRPADRGGADGPDTDAPTGARERLSGRRRLALLAAGALAVMAAGFGIGRMMSSASAGEAGPEASVQELPGVPPFFGTPVPAPTTRVADGTDPAVGLCKDDAHLVDKTPVMRDGAQIGALELLYSRGAGLAGPASTCTCTRASPR